MSDIAPQGRNEIKDLLAVAGHLPSKHLGQNFLTDPNIVHKIVNVARVDRDTRVVEIGAGTGTLTGALASRAERVVAYEIDAGLECVLRVVLEETTNVDVRIADASRIRLEDELDGAPWTMVANLPYNVGTRIVLDALTASPKVDSFTVMVQREVANRMLAGPGSRTYGIPSVIVGLHGVASLAFTVPPQVFEPQPKVESAVVIIDRIEPDVLTDRAIALAGAAFGKRRKMLRGSLATALVDPVATLAAAGIDPTLRAEDVSPEGFLEIARAEEHT